MDDLIFDLPYGEGTLPIAIPRANLLGVIHAQAQQEALVDEASLLESCMANPLGTPPLRQLLRPGSKVAIVTSDLTRPCPSDRLLPYIIRELEAAAIPDEDVFIVLALGIHRPMREEEICQALSEPIRRRFRVLNHDLDDTVRLGVTSRDTPAEFFRPLVEADFSICLGNVEFHYFAGYSGGAKAVMPGCASQAAINANHSMMVLPEACTGRIEGNPLREDLEEAAAMLGVDFILNVVMDEQHRITGACAGEVTAAHRQCCRMVAQRGMLPIARQADIVIATPGGFPKDINFTQSHKAMEAAVSFLRDGGVLILVAQSPEGFGAPTFKEWMLKPDPPQAIIDSIQRQFVLGGHIAAAIAAIKLRNQIYMVSDIPDDIVRRCGFTPFDTPQAALEAAFEQLGRESQVWLIPQAISVQAQLV